MLILLAVLLAVAALVAIQLLNTAKTSSDVVSGQANATLNAACTSSPAPGCPCQSDSDCGAYACDTSTNKCA